MTQALQAFFLMLAGATDKELVRQVEYLKAENQILRSKLPKRVTVTAAERARLLKLGRAVGVALKHLITIVSPRTFARWLAGAKKKHVARRRGRPRTKDETRAIVLRLARENDWGLTRLCGELRNLGIKIGKTTLRNILKEAGIEPGPKRMTGGTWDKFVKRHAASLWQCDFISKRVWTLKGKVEAFVLFFIHVESRKVWASPATLQPNWMWVAQQARNVGMWAADEGLAMSHVVRDRDGKFQSQFDAVLQGQGAEVVPIQYRAPNMNAFAERWRKPCRTSAWTTLWR